MRALLFGLPFTPVAGQPLASLLSSKTAAEETSAPLRVFSLRNALASDPDFLVFIPPAPVGHNAQNEHFLVIPTPARTFLAFWTSGIREPSPEHCVVYSRSLDQGRTWSKVRVLAGDPSGRTGRIAVYGFPVVVPSTGRIYLFYLQNVGHAEVREDSTGELHYRWSDDDGLSWSGPLKLPFPKAAISDPNPDVPDSWIVFQAPIITRRGQALVGFYRWAANASGAIINPLTHECEVWFFRFDNLLSESDPAQLRVTVLPEGAHGLRVTPPGQTNSVAQEPTVHELRDGRMLTVMRTLNGCPYYALSADEGRTWDTPRPLRFGPGRQVIPQPMAPCPLYRLQDGRFILVFYNNDGTANGGSGPLDYSKNRRPAFLAVGREIADADHPLVFTEPRLFLDNGGVPDGPVGLNQIASYCSLFEFEGKVYFWYPDRKHYLLGKIIPAALLDDSDLPH